MNLPEIKSLCLISENILLLTIQEKEVRGGVQIPYIEEPGEILEQDSGIPALVYIVRDGKRIGVRVEDPQFGPKRFPYESLIGESLDLSAADAPNSYLVSGLCPGRVFRKNEAEQYGGPVSWLQLPSPDLPDFCETFFPGLYPGASFPSGAFQL